MLTSAQLATLKAAILADPTANAMPNTADGNYALANYLNAPTIPAVALWRPDVQPAEIAGAVTMSEFTALTTVQQNGLLLLTQGPADATLATIRAAFSALFGVATATRAALLAISQRTATRFENVFAGAAIQGAVVSSFYAVQVTAQDVETARNG